MHLKAVTSYTFHKIHGQSVLKLRISETTNATSAIKPNFFPNSARQQPLCPSYLPFLTQSYLPNFYPQFGKKQNPWTSGCTYARQTYHTSRLTIPEVHSLGSCLYLPNTNDSAQDHQISVGSLCEAEALSTTEEISCTPSLGFLPPQFNQKKKKSSLQLPWLKSSTHPNGRFSNGITLTLLCLSR